ncbi:MAG: aminotransferase class IV [Oceanicaulis sp.]
MTLVWLDGHVLDADEARIAPDDRGFLLGDAAFETLRFEAGGIRRWARHRDRLSGALDWLGIARPDFDALEDAARTLTGRLELSDAVLRLTVSRGPHGGGLDAPTAAAGTVLLTARPRPAPPESVSLVTVASARRAGLESERFKLAGYAEPLAARRAARARGADMGLMVSALDGGVVCADCANLFVVAEDGLATPPLASGALPGTVRAALTAAAAASGRPIMERALSPDDLARVEAAFVTNAVMGVVPVAHLDGRALNPFHPAILAARSLEALAY